ncbi:hypothetical protein [Foetidibacter luteolus]|uniref:hypothetical protein n=1 Tax=Foetidibacter luteolus TaxID=2608880 RepID=UPI00129B51E3|nr:hypothetical protein [Foetidibacter luteolus]
MSEKDAAGNKFKIKTFDEYYNLYCNNKANSGNKHAERLNLIQKKQLSIAPHYKWLKDTCWTARYYEYKFNIARNYIEEAKRRLEIIKKCCEAK